MIKMGLIRYLLMFLKFYYSLFLLIQNIGGHETIFLVLLQFQVNHE